MNKISSPFPADSYFNTFFRNLSKGISLFVIAVGCLVIIGWMLDITMLKSILPGLASMKSNTALLLILGGISLRMQIGRQASLVTQGCAFIIAFISFLTIGEYLFNNNFGIDQFLFRDTAIGALHPGRMSPSTAIVFLLLGLSLLFLDRQSETRFAIQLLVLFAFTICGLALIGYIYEISSLYKIGMYSSMALHTAFSLLLLSLGILFARPQYGLMQTVLADTLGGDVLRRFLPGAIIAPILLGWVILQGQYLGLYDTAFGFMFMVISLIAILATFALLNAHQLTNIDIKRRQSHASLHASELRFRSTLENMSEGCQIIGYDWRYLFLNDSAMEQSQLDRDQMLGHTMMECYPGIEDTALFATLRECMEKRTSSRMTNELIYPNGSSRWFELNIQPAPDGIFLLSSDITQQRQSQAALLEREMKLTTLFEILPVGISILGADRTISYTNPALKRILDISEGGLLTESYRNRKYLRADGTLMPGDELASTQAFKENREIIGVQIGVVKEDDSIVWTEVSAVPVDFPDWKLVMVTSDISDRKRAENEILKLNAELEHTVTQRTAELAEANKNLLQLSFFDELTGLYNRRGFLLIAEEQLSLARRVGWNLLVFYADLDGLKQINDQLGHTAGDEAIAAVAQALNKAFRISDIKARIGGDEFIVLAFDIRGQVAQKMLANLREKLAENHQSMSVGMIALEVGSEISLDDLITRADEAMYAEKRTKPHRR